MKNTNIKKISFISALGLFLGFGSILFLNGPTVHAGAFQCQSQYNDYARNKSDKAGIDGCLRQKPAKDYCNVAAHRQSDGSDPVGDCADAYVDGFFGENKGRYHTAINQATYAFGDKSASDYEAVYKEQQGGGSSGGGGSTTTGGGGSTTSTPSGDSPTSPGSTGSETKPSKWQGNDEDVAVKKLAPGSVSVTKQQAADNGLFNISADNLIKGILNAVYSLVAITAVIAIVAAGIVIILADGDANKVATARRAIIYASAGLVIVGTAFIITGIVQGIGTQ